MSEDKTLELNREPSPKDEAIVFSTPDERRDNQNHELKLLHAKQGHIGRLIGCDETNLTIAFTVLVAAIFCAAACLIGMIWQKDTFMEALKFFGTIILTFGGYVFGVVQGKKEG